MRAKEIVFVAAKDRFDALLEPVSSKATEPLEASTKPVEPKPVPERNILRLFAADFAGPYRGNVGGEGFAGADRLSGRYRRLRGF
jgi:hypothetical protein